MTDIETAFEETGVQLDRIIDALKRKKPLNPKTIVTYQGGVVQEYLIEGELGQNSIPDKMNAVQVEIGTAVTSIGDAAFVECSSLTSIMIPNSVTSIGDYAFAASGLTSVSIPDSVMSIGSYAFDYCYSLTSIMIPNSVTSIDEYAFQRCSGLTSITIPDSVTSIGDYAFFDCSGLTSLTIGNGVINIGNDAFPGCTALSSITSYRTSAPTVQYSTFGYSSGTYVGRNTYSSGNNVLKVPQGATGYDTDAWADPLQDSTMCGFHIEYI